VKSRASASRTFRQKLPDITSLRSQSTSCTHARKTPYPINSRLLEHHRVQLLSRKDQSRMWHPRHAMHIPTPHCYATIASGKALRGKGPALTLEHVSDLRTQALGALVRTRFRQQARNLSINVKIQFLQRSRALALWRDVVRATNKISPELSTKYELRVFARAEFERNKFVHDLVSWENLGRTKLLGTDVVL
jgi:hypothetical protein